MQPEWDGKFSPVTGGGGEESGGWLRSREIFGDCLVFV